MLVNNKKYRLVFIFILIFLSACSTELKYHMKNHQFLTPETKGEFLKGDVALAYQQTQKVVLAEAFDPLIFNLPAVANTQASITRSASVDIPINLGLLKRLDIYNLDSKFGFKYQFLGTAENELKEEYKVALAVSYGSQHETSATETYTNSASARVYNTDMKVNSTDVSLLLGYRFNDTRLIYLNIFRDNFNYNGSLTSNQFSSINLSGVSYNQGMILGASFNEKEVKHPVIARIELGVVNSKLDNRNSNTVGTSGADLGFSW